MKIAKKARENNSWSNVESVSNCLRRENICILKWKIFFLPLTTTYDIRSSMYGMIYNFIVEEIWRLQIFRTSIKYDLFLCMIHLKRTHKHTVTFKVILQWAHVVFVDLNLIILLLIMCPTSSIQKLLFFSRQAYERISCR